MLDTREARENQRLMRQSPCPQGAYWPAEYEMHVITPKLGML